MKLKKVLKGIGIGLLVLIAILIAIPYLFKSQIIARVKTELNKSLNAKVDFKDVDISLFRRFPRLAVALEELQVTGVQHFEGDTLLAVRRLDLALDLMSAIKGENISIYNVSLQQPRIYALVDEEGRPNWDIVKPDTDTAGAAPEDTSKSEFAFSLQQYSIEDAVIKYDDLQGHMHLAIEGLNHKGKGDFTQDNFVLSTSTTAGSLSYAQGFIPYLLNTKMEILADIQIDNNAGKYSFKTDKISINNLKLSTEGFFQLVNDSSYNMDISFQAPSTDFKDILSLVPAVYSKDFASIKTSGAATFKGFVKGMYAGEQMPAYELHLGIKDGFFQYPDLPKPVKNIQLAVNVTNPDGVPDHTIVDVPQAHLEMDDSPVDLRLMIKTPISDLYLDAAAKGRLDLGKVGQFVKFENGTRLSGLLDADLQARGYMSAIERQQYEAFHAAGKISVADMAYKSKDYPDGVNVSSLLMTFNPKNVTVSDFKGQYLGTNFNANGEVNNLLAYLFQNDALNGRLALTADQVNLNKWMATGEATPEGKPADTASSVPFAVPNNLDFTLQAQAGKVIYDKVDLNNLNGTLLVRDEAVIMKDIKANALQGTMKIDGSYSTKLDKNNPDINFTYDVKELDVQETFKAFNTVQKLMPIAQFLSGKMSSQMTVNGKLGKDMSPVLSSLSGDGNLLLIQGFLKKFAPMDQLANQLNVNALKDISIRDIKNYFAFQNGRMTVNPFRIKMNNFNMLVGGSHGFDQSMDYTMQLALPRALLGQQGNGLVNNLVKQANNKGIPVNVGDTVYLNVLLGGNIMKPSVKTDLKEAAGKAAENLKDQATAMVKNKIDTVQQTLKDSLKHVKNEAVNAAKDELKKQLLGGKDTTGNSGGIQGAGKAAEKTLNNTLKGLLNKRKNTAADSTKN
ncbi:AsmA-like C-terminal region-containing protein [Chitinophaga deserti]|uniref:AsmA-like C-terminal region-containing protein n=1 Tax=Chitinophaga deserti TaxID=2164099 RepID=UPI000D6B4A7D|nr:AsmA-like C-terminal region-containing protein [Chitinophaga deserti]